ncbi:hypothetical protein GYMLUDRAFT_249591 [Collybiopsis luxurians FD-317 M1]|uniref:Uncharacterized protein n=1 Tax=Collybiopsis luxurians FD-317 M1 TaxID=944289 RepID=A0A0D0BXE6_9AGAR|nr:hypothetical protein GYMLUDRAFT_249591 [Collybiopsis luxurians FD-317 M1]
MDLWCWTAGFLVNEEQLILWCQDQPGLDSKIIEDLGPFDYAHKFLDKRPNSPDLYCFFGAERKPKAMFMCRTVFTSPGAPKPDLSASPWVYKTMSRWSPTETDQLQRYNIYHVLAAQGQAEILEHLLKKLPRDVNEALLIQQSERALETLLYLTVLARNYHISSAIIDYTKPDLMMYDATGSIPLHIAVANSQVKTLTEELSAFARLMEMKLAAAKAVAQEKEPKTEEGLEKEKWNDFDDKFATLKILQEAALVRPMQRQLIHLIDIQKSVGSD